MDAPEDQDRAQARATLEVLGVGSGSMGQKSRIAVVVDETQPCIAKIPTSKTLS
jgi:hypothetical protein